MHVVEVLVAVAEAGINRGIGEPEEVLFMTVQASPIDSFLVRSIDVSGIASPEHPEVIRPVRVMACLAISRFDRAMEMFFSGEFLFDVSQRRSAQIVLVVAAQTSGHLVERKQALFLRIVSRVAGDAAIFLLEWLVRYLQSGQFLPDLDMALNAEIRHLFLE